MILDREETGPARVDEAFAFGLQGLLPLDEPTGALQAGADRLAIGVGRQFEEQLFTQDVIDGDGAADVAGDVDVFEVGGVAQRKAGVIVAVAELLEVGLDVVVFGALHQAEVHRQRNLEGHVDLATADAGMQQREAGLPLHAHHGGGFVLQRDVDAAGFVARPFDVGLVVDELADPGRRQVLFDVDGAAVEVVDEDGEVDAVALDAAGVALVAGAFPLLGAGAGSLDSGRRKANVLTMAAHG